MENYFQNKNCFYWIKLIPVLIHLKYWYYNSSYLQLPYLPHHLCKILPQLLEIKARPMKFIIKLYTGFGAFRSNTLLNKNLILKGHFSSKVTQHGQQQLWLHPKYAKFSTKWWVLVHYYNPTCACNQCYNLQQRPVLLLQSIFTPLFHPYLFTKSSLQSSLTFSSSIL